MFRWRRRLFLGLILGCSAWIYGEDAKPAAPAEESSMPSLRPNIKIHTLGGVQFWGDVLYFHGWHIQRNIFSGHHRLLDVNDIRHAWGTREACDAKLKEICDAEKLAPMHGTAVILLHGLGRSDKSVGRLKRFFEKAGYYTIAMNYPSLRASVQDNAEYLHEVIQSLHGIEKVHLVGFSMGGIVVRQCLAEHVEPRLGRIVFIGSPNQGAELATLLKDWWAFKTFVGPAGQDLATAPHGLAPKLPAPNCEFGVIAGCRGADGGYNPLIPGDDDGTVSLESTRLPGASDFLTVHRLHQLLLSTPSVFTATQHFLEEGTFQADRDPQPIPREAAEGPPEGIPAAEKSTEKETP